MTRPQFRACSSPPAATVAQDPQADQTLNIGPQLDVTRAVETLLAKKFKITVGAAAISVAERQELPDHQRRLVHRGHRSDAIDLAGPGRRDRASRRARTRSRRSPSAWT